MATLSIQLYSLRNHGALPEQLDVARDAGFTSVETVGGMLEDAAGLRALLDARGLAAPSGHVAMDVMRNRFDFAVEAAQTLGITTLIVPAFHPPMRPTDAAGWSAIGAELGELATRLEAHGIGFAFHNHHWEVAPLPDGALPLDLLLDAGRPGGLRWQADLAWLVRGSDDVHQRLARHGDSLHSVHVKDIAAPGEAEDEDGWADVGHGTLDWTDFWAISQGQNPLMVAEHDKPSDAARFARRSYEAMSRLDGAHGDGALLNVGASV